MRDLLICIFLFLFPLISKADFIINARLIEAQNYISRLQLRNGQALVDAEKKENPNNQATYFIENYIDIYRIIASQSKDDYKKLLPNRDLRLNILSKKTNPSPYFLYAQADVHLQWAFVKSQNGDYLSAAMDFRSAFQLLEKNASLYPNFLLNNKDLGILKVIIGIIPDGYKWIASIVGLNGNYEEGMGMMRKFISSNSNSQQLPIELQSAKILYCLMQINFEKNKITNWVLTEKYTSDFETNLMSACIRAFIAHKCDMTDEGIRNLLLKPHTKDYVNFHYTDFLLGSMKLTRLDEDATVYLKKFVSLCSNKSLYEEAYTKLAWSYLIKGDTSEYYLYIGLSKKYRESDKQWPALPSQGVPEKLPNLVLLKTRLLTDGGYYSMAEKELQLLTNRNINDIERIEYHYRLAKISQETNKYQKAIDNYLLVIKLGAITNLYIIPNSHLQLGIIYNKLGNKELSLLHYNQALSYKNYQYKYSIEQKAKAGISILTKNGK